MLYQEIKKCRICGNKNLVEILNLGEQALTGVFPKKNEEVESGPLEIVKCFSEETASSCGLVQLKHDYKMEKLYGDSYGYRSGLNKSMIEHLADIVRAIEKRVPLRDGDLVIDIASNDGTLLGCYQNKALDLWGIDPTAKKFQAYYPNHVNKIASFFSEEVVQTIAGAKKAQVVTSIAMFYDLPDPFLIMKEIANVLADEGIWVVEQSYMPEMISNVSYDTICHEHLEFYALRQFKWMADRAGLKIIAINFNKTNGASFCLTLAKQSSKYKEAQTEVDQILAEEERAGFNGLQIYEQFKAASEAHRRDLKDLMNRIKGEGKRILGYGASTKGNVILQYCGLGVDNLACIADVNADKFDRYTPGTGIPIVSEETAKKLNPDYFLVLPWHFKAGIVGREQEFLRGGGKLIFPLPKIEII